MLISFSIVEISLSFWLSWIHYALWHCSCLIFIDNSTCAYYSKEKEYLNHVSQTSLDVSSWYIQMFPGITCIQHFWKQTMLTQCLQSGISAILVSQRVWKDFKLSVLLSFLTSTLIRPTLTNWEGMSHFTSFLWEDLTIT